MLHYVQWKEIKLFAGTTVTEGKLIQFAGTPVTGPSGNYTAGTPEPLFTADTPVLENTKSFDLPP